jgi:hypothetical protein
MRAGWFDSQPLLRTAVHCAHLSSRPSSPSFHFLTFGALAACDIVLTGIEPLAGACISLSLQFISGFYAAPRVDSSMVVLALLVLLVDAAWAAIRRPACAPEIVVSDRAWCAPTAH